MKKNETQSLAGYLRQHFETIQQQIEFGIRQEVILSELKQKGYTTTLKNLRNELSRVRKKLAEKDDGKKQTPSPTKDVSEPTKPAPSKPNSTSSTGFVYGGTSNPDDLI